MHALKVGEHHLPLERVPMLTAGVLHHGIGHGVLVLSGKVLPTARARLVVGHSPILSRRDGAKSTRNARFRPGAASAGAADPNEARARPGTVRSFAIANPRAYCRMSAGRASE